MKRWDAVVVGSGATGGWVAKQLTEAGMEVLVLEAGPALAPSELPGARPPAPDDAWHARKPVQKRLSACNAETQHLYVDDVDNPYTTPEDKPFDWFRGRQAGGRSVTWGAYALRFSDVELKAASRDGVGEDWPLSHEELAPFYDRVEELLGVWGTREGLPQLPDSRFARTEPMTRGEELFKAAVEKRWPDRRVIHARSVIDDDGGDGRWPVKTSQGSTLAAAMKTGRLTLRCGAVVRQVLHDPADGTARGVAFIDASTRRDEEALGRLVILCASTIESARLLLNSRAPACPDGLGNSSGLLGRNLMDHPKLKVTGTVPALAGLPCAVSTASRSVYVPKFRNVRERHEAFVRGYGIQACVQRHGAWSRGYAGQVPFGFWAAGEMLPRPENRVTIDPARTDAWGIPAARVECAFGRNELAMAADMTAAMREMAQEVGFEVRHEGALSRPGSFIHEVGTARMGLDPARSVLNRFQQSWDVRNLFILDGSGFVTSGCQNPTLTMMALAVRACDFIVANREIGRGAG